MPYIEPEERQKLGPTWLHSNAWMFRRPGDVGQLTYLLTDLCVSYLPEVGMRYQHIAEVIGALECAKQEFYRRVASPYENKKREENGDVYP